MRPEEQTRVLAVIDALLRVNARYKAALEDTRAAQLVFRREHAAGGVSDPVSRRMLRCIRALLDAAAMLEAAMLACEPDAALAEGLTPGFAAATTYTRREVAAMRPDLERMLLAETASRTPRGKLH